MKNEILYTMGLDQSGRLIHINNAEKGNHYFCPCCKKEFILRKSGKSGKGSRRPHFAHNELTTNCTPESVLHYSFKRLLIEELEKCKKLKEEFIFNWDCSICNEHNAGNLLTNVEFIKEEYFHGDCRSDIALLNDEEKILVAIEIVVTHMPEEKTLKYYEENNIVLIRIDLTSEDDLVNVIEKATNPNLVTYCINPVCHSYIEQNTQRKIIISNYRCGRCLFPIEKYYIEIDGIFGKSISRHFQDKEIEMVKSRRNNIEVRIDVGEKQKYPYFVCINCKRILTKYRRSRF